jgi:hypothetical protein
MSGTESAARSVLGKPVVGLAHHRTGIDQHHRKLLDIVPSSDVQWRPTFQKYANDENMNPGGGGQASSQVPFSSTAFTSAP